MEEAVYHIRRPLLAGDRASQIHFKLWRFLLILQTPKALWGPRLLRRPPLPNPISMFFSRHCLDVSDFGPNFCCSKIHQKSDLYQTLPKSHKSDPWVSKARGWNHFRWLLASLFRSIFPDHLNLVICNRYNAKTSLLPFQASHFSIKNRSKNLVFSKSFLGSPFSHCFSIFFKNSRF